MSQPQLDPDCYSESCRLCINKPANVGISEVKGLAEDIHFYTGIKVSSKDNLPQNICSKCFHIIVDAKELKIVATNNDTNLKVFLKENGINTEGEANTKESHVDKGISKLKKGSQTTDTSRTSDTDDAEDSLHIATESKTTSISVRKDLFGKRNSDSLEEPEPDSTPETKHSPRNTRHKRKKNETYECDECGKVFQHHKKFYFHKRSHNKNCVCPIGACGKKFATNPDLMRHIRVHTGEKPYECDVCGRKFTQGGTLKQHFLSLHPDVPYKE